MRYFVKSISGSSRNDAAVGFICRLIVGLFILSPLLHRRAPGADDADYGGITFYEHSQDKALPLGRSNQDRAIGISRIFKEQRQRILKTFGRFFKGNSVLSFVRGGFGWLPFEQHQISVTHLF